MNDNNINQKNLKGLENVETDQDFKNGFAFMNDSEIVINTIIEKIISLVITKSMKNKIENLLSNYCFEEVKQSLEILTSLDFLTHDKDDLDIKHKLSLERIKSSKNLKRKNNSLIIKDEEKENSFDNSENIRKYKLERHLDLNAHEECSIDLDVFAPTNNEKSTIKEKKEKEINNIVMGILVREEYQDKTTSFQQQEEKKRKIIEKENRNFNYNFQDDKDKMFKRIYSNEIDPFQINPDEKIESIKNVEIHKIDFLPPQPLISAEIGSTKNIIYLPYDTAVDSTNFWRELPQPKPPSIDRDAGTKIKFEKLNINKKKQIAIPEDKIIIEEQKNSNNNKPPDSPKKKTKFNFLKKKDNDNNNKKKKYVQIEFESTDIDPKNLETYSETNEIMEMRLKVEKELQEKKIELLKIAQKEREKIAREEEIEERRKELSKKNVTTDIKGELVFIKPIDMKALNDEFNKGRSNFKIIKTIETASNLLKNKKNLVVEKNPEMNLWDFKDDKSKKKSKKKKEHLLLKTPSAISNSPKKGEQKLFDKHDMKYASGSNFTIINPEVGVSIIENKQVKSGGKDFYKKYNRFSLEVFQDQLNKTAKTNFFPSLTEPTNTIDNMLERPKRINSKKKLLKEIDHNNKILEENHLHEENKTISVKTKNLNIALQNLDLINEKTERNLSQNKKVINKNFIKNALNKFSPIKTEFNDMNIFAKTLMGKQNWGGEIYSDTKKTKNFRMPKKPEEIELQRELPATLLKHMPRKRLPPIGTNFKANNMGQTSMGFYTNRKSKKIKLMIDENKKNVKTEREN